MKTFISFREILLLSLLIISIILYSCKCNVEDPQPVEYNYLNVPAGDTAIVENLNIAGMGGRKNNPETTWIVKGHVVMDHLQIAGNVVIEDNSRLTILGILDVQEEGKVIVKHELKYMELKQAGEVVYKNKND